jgi:hypothetical protein
VDQSLFFNAFVKCAAGWYQPAGGSGPALLKVSLRNKTTGELTLTTIKTIEPGSQDGLATTPVATIRVDITGESDLNARGIKFSVT